MLESLVFIIGLIIGSFTGVCIFRVPRMESVVSPASHCPQCSRPIRFYENIPVISFLVLMGRCRGCRLPISWRYPMVELIQGIGYLFIYHQWGLTIPMVVYALFFSSLIVVIFIDLDHQIIPDRITLPGIVIGLVASTTLLPTGFLNATIGLFLGGGLFYLIATLSWIVLKKEGMGGGDIKFIAMIGTFLGWKGVLLTIFLGSASGSVIGLLGVLFHKIEREAPIPFGPFLAVGALLTLFWEAQILHWYLPTGLP